MDKTDYIYDIDDNPPLKYSLLYGLQWAVIMFSFLIITASLGSKALHLDAAGEVRFFQLILMASGLFTTLQCLAGHRYPLLEGPSTALLLTFIILAPYGIQAIQGGTIAGGALLMVAVVFGRLKNVAKWATPNVVGVILMLIAFSLLPFLTRMLTGMNHTDPDGNITTLLASLGLIVIMAFFSHWLKGFWKTISLLLGIAVGSLLFSFLKMPEFHALISARWFSFPPDLIPAEPIFTWPAILAFAASYVAVVVNTLGSIHGIAGLTDLKRLPKGISRGLFFNGVAGVCCGLMGIVGFVSYSISPGVVVANRVASRFVTAIAGIMLIAAALVPKFAALLAMVPSAVVGAALAVAMSAQIGAALVIIAEGGIHTRDYFVVGLPVLLGTVVSFLPGPFMSSLPAAMRMFLGNGLIFGIFLVLLFEHVVFHETPSRKETE